MIPNENPEKFQHSDKKTLIVISSPLKRNGVVAYTCKYGGNRCWTSLLLYHGGEFTKFPGRKYIKGKQTYIDLLDMDTFSVHDIDEMMEQLGYVDEGIPLYYHFKRPFSDLDFGLFALGSDQDVRHLGTFISKHKLIEVYIEHGKTQLHTYTMSPNQAKVQIKEIIEPPSCSRRLFLDWYDTGETNVVGDASKEANVMDVTGDDNMDITDNGDNNKKGNPCVEVEIGDKFEHTNEVEFRDGNKGGEDPWSEFESGDMFEDINEEEFGSGDNFDDDSGYKSSESDDIDFYVDNDNILDDVEVDMNDFNDNIDMDAEWVGGMNDNVVQEENEVGELNEVLNNEVLLSGSSSDEGPVGQRKKTIKAIQRAHENDEANVAEPFYILQTFNTAQEFKERVKVHAIETRRELGFEKNDKNRVRVVCRGTIPKLGNLDKSGEGQQEVNNEDEEKCPWSLYASKWKRDINWMVKSYNKEHRCLQTRNVKACTYKFLAKKITTQVESNPTIPIRALQEQLQRDYQVGLSKMKVFRARTEALNQVRGDYVGQYALLRDYVQELQKHNPDTTVKIDVESEPNPNSETRTFKRIYICLGPLKKGFAAGRRDFLGLDGAFMKGPYPGQILSAVGIDGDDLGLGTNSNFTFMTDRQKGVLPAIAKLFPCAEHRYCLRHIHENMKANWRAKQFKDLLWDCAKASTIQQFQRSMEELRKLNNDAYEWLKNIPPQHWSRSHFTGRAHTDAMLNNMCESLNSKIVEGRDVPIITCLEYIREYLVKKIVTVQKEIDKAVGPLTPTATIWVEKLKKEASQLRSVFCGNGKYQVSKNLLEQFVVDMGQQTCSCRRWELIGIPCAHAIACMWEMLKNKEIDKIPEHWVHRTYWLETWKNMYSFTIHPINGRNMWEKSTCPTTLLPPKHHVPIGRPKKKRRRSAMEVEDLVKGNQLSRAQKSVTCSKCNKSGHNARTCKGQKAGGSQSSRNVGGSQTSKIVGGAGSEKVKVGSEKVKAGGSQTSRNVSGAGSAKVKDGSAKVRASVSKKGKGVP
ncbi:unnamed protein product [Lactuca saligna]|uniref:SWIM-type domain-containing protein n=1 Tax=Lactuca saligna TaxID=75948 RepID=A0AA36EBJ7_LACSI|nr:unnamed protein product [Lactuca saligna]